MNPRRAYDDILPAARREEPDAPTSAGLPESTSRALVQLLQGPYLMRERHPRLWPALLADEPVIRQRLADLFLDLVIDPDAGLAFVRNRSDPDADLPRVIRSSPLTLIDTALVLHLRDLLLRAEASEGRVFVGRDEIDDHLGVYAAASNTDRVTFAKRVNASVEKLKKNSVLLSSAEEGRYEISPILAMVFDADQVLAVARELRALAGITEAGDTMTEGGPA
ncbi:MAG: DUF4194 domain-containing protein [Micropruina sp.]|uniref:DUF4194 domain-containing protein n=1 Tax=Micropruina sp. TaxID=2737536 RepID=UPI0039E4AD3E